MSLSDEELRKLILSAAPLQFAEDRAKKLLKQIPDALLFVSICGVKVDFELFELIDGFLSIRKVTNSPGFVHVMRAANTDKADYLSVSRYSHLTQAEITIGDNIHQVNESSLLDFAYHTAALFKLKGYSLLFCPSSSSVSWDTISAFSDNSVNFQMLDDIPHQIGFIDDSSTISIENAEWVKNNFTKAFEMRNFEKSHRFGLAFNIMYSWNQTTNSRIAISNIWAGLEALFGKQSDKRITEALAQRISEWLPFTSKEEIKNLYNQRCNAVHGRWLNEKEIWEAIKKSELLLQNALIKCIETSTKTLADED